MRHTYRRLRDELNIHPKHMILDSDNQELHINLTKSSKVIYNAKHLKWVLHTNIGSKKETTHKHVGTLDAFFNWVKDKLDGKPLL